MDKLKLLRFSIRFQELLLQRDVVKPQLHEKVHPAVGVDVFSPAGFY